MKDFNRDADAGVCDYRSGDRRSCGPADKTHGSCLRPNSPPLWVIADDDQCGVGRVGRMKSGR